MLDALTIARSRRHIANHYQSEMNRLGGFPKRIPPLSIHPEIDSAKEFPSYDDVAQDISQYKLWLFRPSDHLREDLAADLRENYQRRIGGFTQQGRERILTAMMRVGLLKRLESSIDSFRISLQNTLDKISHLEGRMHRFEQFRDANPDLDFDNFLFTRAAKSASLSPRPRPSSTYSANWPSEKLSPLTICAVCSINARSRVMRWISIQGSCARLSIP